ncbi:MAG: hypothetical protein JW798_13370 [Prolixibacteraceae bacterium]|nr:hypothetical protein [Prolixibacteraceae bacterium]
MKKPFIQNIAAYKKQMELGTIPEAYKGLIEYMMGLRTYLKTNYLGYHVGSFYQGYMDITYFPVVTTVLKDRNLKLAIVFDHLKIRFEIWLSGQNRRVQKEYLSLFNKIELEKNYMLTENPDSVIEMVVLENPDFSDLNKITTEIETSIKKFITHLTGILK